MTEQQYTIHACSRNDFKLDVRRFNSHALSRFTEVLLLQLYGRMMFSMGLAKKRTLHAYWKMALNPQQSFKEC